MDKIATRYGDVASEDRNHGGVVGSLKSLASARESRMGSLIGQRWLAGAEKWLKRQWRRWKTGKQKPSPAAIAALLVVVTGMIDSRPRDDHGVASPVAGGEPKVATVLG